MKQFVTYKHLFLICAALFLLTALAFEPVRNNQFTDSDDVPYITANNHVKSGINAQSIKWAFTSFHAGNWHPLTWLSHMLDCQLFGLDPLPHHLVNLLYHAANSILLFLILFSATRALWPAAFIAALFAIHPLHVESVAWAAERKDVLSTFFCLLTIASYIKYAKNPSIRAYLLVIILFALGLMAKPMLVTLPLILLLLDYWPLERFSPIASHLKLPPLRLIAEKIPLLLLAAASSILTCLAQSDTMRRLYQLSITDRIENASVAYIQYILNLFYPNNLAPLYPLRHPSPPLWQSILCTIVLLLLTAAFIRLARRKKYLLFGWLWYLITLIPVIGLIQVGEQAIADRYMYIPSIGIFIIIAFTAADLALRHKILKPVFIPAALAIIISFTFATRTQTAYWQNDLTLFGHAVAVTQNNFRMHNSYGLALMKANRSDEAVRQFTLALEAKPGYLDAMENLAAAFKKTNYIDDAIELWQAILKMKPVHPDINFQLGLALTEKGDINAAVSFFEKELQLNPNHIDANFNMGVAMARLQRNDEAEKYFKKAIKLKPDKPDTHYYLAGIYQRQRKTQLVIDECLEVIRLKPDHVKARQLLADSFLEASNIPAASDHLAKLAFLLAASPDSAIRQPALALELAQKACQLTQQNDPAALDALAVAYAANARFPDAINTANKALTIARQSANNALADEIASRLALYKMNKPYLTGVK